MTNSQKENFSPLIFDTHAHYDDEVFQNDFDDLIFSLKQSGVSGIITCGCNKESSLKAIELAEKYDIIYAAVGIHPGNIDDGTTVDDIKSLLSHPKCVAIGEIGLDYYWRQDNKQQQIELFKAQLQLANQFNLPVLVHDRDAHAVLLADLIQLGSFWVDAAELFRDGETVFTKQGNVKLCGLELLQREFRGGPDIVRSAGENTGVFVDIAADLCRGVHHSTLDRKSCRRGERG